MSPIFADTHFYVALLNRRDSMHSTALHWAEQQRPVILTTEFVLLEVANFFKQPSDRAEFVRFVESVRADVASEVIPCDSAWFQKGLDRFEARSDKEWSLTDCISFVVMEERGVTRALAKDHHFAQAGFMALLK